MATDVSATFEIAVNVTERETALGIGAKASKLEHPLRYGESFSNGVGANKVSAVFSEKGTLAATTRAFDLRGGLSSVLTGDAVAFPLVTTIIVRNKSVVAGETLIVGAGSNPFITWLNATGDAVIVGPGGLFVLHSPIDGYATTAATADILLLDSGAASVPYEIEIIGRAS